MNQNSKMTRWWLDTRDKPGLLWAFLNYFREGSLLVLTGQLEQLRLFDLPGAERRVRPPEAKQTSWPELDVVAIPITADNTAELKQRLSSPTTFTDPGLVVEAEIIAHGQCVFLAGDSFHRECVSAMPPTPESLLKVLVSSGVIRSYVAA